jgi:hypothetical protein
MSVLTHQALASLSQVQVARNPYQAWVMNPKVALQMMPERG